MRANAELSVTSWRSTPNSSNVFYQLTRQFQEIEKEAN